MSGPFRPLPRAPRSSPGVAPVCRLGRGYAADEMTFDNLKSDPTIGRADAYPAFWTPFEIVGEGAPP
jgi:hypothetical protein